MLPLTTAAPLGAAPSISYWIITPEAGTDAVVDAIRNSWMRGAGADARFCVARGLSTSADQSLHWLSGLSSSQLIAKSRFELNKQLTTTVASAFDNRTAHEILLEVQPSNATAASASALPSAQTKKLAEKAWALTRKYNLFLRHKVFEMMREICRAMQSHAFNYAFIMDADTSVNRTNLEDFVRPLKPTEVVYTGMCKRRWAAGNKHVLRGVGGGPGILLSRPLLQKTCPALEHCAPLRTLMDKLEKAGGDLMIAKCMEFLGVRCQMTDELGVSGDVSELFRRGPPWVYPPLPPGTVLVASKGSTGAREILRAQKSARLDPSKVISYHRVMPLAARPEFRDVRCRILAEYTRKMSGPANWYSRCLPHFALLGVPKSGSTSLFNWVLQHPEVRAPQRKELHMWAPVLTPDKACLDRSSCAVLAATRASEAEAAAEGADADAGDGKQGGGKKGGGGRKDDVAAARPRGGRTAGGDALREPPSTPSVRRVMSAYLDFFPEVDPREFAVTGEASPAYVYSASAALFFGHKLMAHARLLLLLRDPAERAFSEYKNKRDLMLKGGDKPAQWVWGYKRFGPLAEALRPAADGCTPAQLYASCEPCQRFLAAPHPHGAPHGAPPPRTGAGAAAPTVLSGADEGRCQVPPVVWQSWYQLFLPRWLAFGDRLLLEFSDDVFTDAAAVMERVRSFLGLHAYAFNTAVAYNTEDKRGAVISHKGNSSRNAQAAAAARHSHAEASPQQMRILERLVADAALRTNDVLAAGARSGSWHPPLQQFRRSVPQAWLTRYASVVGAA